MIITLCNIREEGFRNEFNFINGNIVDNIYTRDTYVSRRTSFPKFLIYFLFYVSGFVFSFTAGFDVYRKVSLWGHTTNSEKKKPGKCSVSRIARRTIISFYIIYDTVFSLPPESILFRGGFFFFF